MQVNNKVLLSAVGEPAVDAALDQYNAGSAGGTATVTLAAEAGKAWVIKGLVFSCSADPSAGALGIAATGMTSRSYKVTNKGPGAICLPALLVCPVGAEVTVTYATGGGAGVPTLEVFAWKE